MRGMVRQLTISHKENFKLLVVAGEESNDMDDPELEAIKARVRAMEEESEKLRELQSEVDKQLAVPTSPSAALNLSFEEKMDVDSRSVYIGNVDYGATAEELEQHFHGCGSINRLVPIPMCWHAETSYQDKHFKL